MIENNGLIQCKRNFYTLILLILVCFSHCTYAEKINLKLLSGRDILDTVKFRHSQDYEFEIQELALIDKSGKQETREMHRYKRKINDDETRLISVFTSPIGIKGVSLLTWQHEQQENDQWIYLPAYGKKLKRIARGSRRNYFMGTDYTFEDLSSENYNYFQYKRLDDQILDQKLCFVIRATAIDPETKKQSGYGSRLIWISQTHYLIMKIDFFNQREKRIKQQRNLEPKHIQGLLWRHQRHEMEHFIHQHTTVTTIQRRSFNIEDIPEKYFRHRSVTSGILTR